MLAEYGAIDSPFIALTSTALAPPHRPHLLQSGIYSPLLRSHSWIKRYTVLQELGDPEVAADNRGRGGIPRGHAVISEAYGSTGCVNASAWEDTGVGARLATAGDDTKICIWSPGVEAGLHEHGGDAQSPSLAYGLTETIDTGHRANIFDVAWAPKTPNSLFSVAGDQTVRVYDLSLSSNSRLSSTSITPPAPHRPFTHHEDASACTQVYRCHFDRVKRIATEASPYIFLTCGEDGAVRQHDTRQHHQCRTSRFQDPADAGCPPPLASYPSLSLYSLSLSLLRPHLFVVAGTSSYAFLHDRRMLRKAATDWQISSTASASNDLTTCVRRFGVPNPVEPWEGELTKHIVSAKLSPERPSDLLVSYSDDAMYLFDTDADTYTRPSKPMQPKEDEMWRGGEMMEDDRDDQRQSEEEEDDDDDDAIDAALGPSGKSDFDDRADMRHPAEFEDGVSGEYPELEEEANGAGEEGEEEDNHDDDSEDGFDPYAPNAIAPASDVPMIAPTQKYEGHANSQTVKDCNWLSGDLVVSGSDDGNWFAYDRNSGEVRGIFKGDSSVGNHHHKQAVRATADNSLAPRWSTCLIHIQDSRSLPSAESMKLSNCSARLRTPNWRASRISQMSTRPSSRGTLAGKGVLISDKGSAQ